MYRHVCVSWVRVMGSQAMSQVLSNRVASTQEGNSVSFWDERDWQLGRVIISKIYFLVTLVILCGVS